MPANTGTNGVAHTSDVDLKFHNGIAQVELEVYPRQCFTNEALSRLNSALDTVETTDQGSVSHVLLMSRDPKVYNYGGDLSFFFYMHLKVATDRL